MISLPLVKYVLTAARRDRLVWTFTLMIAAAASLSVFLGGAAMAEGGQFSLVFAAGALRVLGVLGVVLFCCFHMRRAFENKEVEFLLSRPLPRTAFLFSHAAAFALVAAGAALVVLLPLVFAGAPDPAGLLAFGISLVAEYAIMAVAALFFSLVLSSAAAAALAVFGFYALARLIGTLIGIAAAAPDSPVFMVLGKILDVISIVVPRLDLMAQTSWLVYGIEGAGGIALMQHAGPYAQWLAGALGVTGFIAAQAALFIALLLAASAFDFSRRRF